MAPASQARPVRLLTTGGTISMHGQTAQPRLDGAGMVAAIPALAAVTQLTVQDVLSLPSSQITLAQALELAQLAGAAAAAGEGVAITTGTDTLEELAMLCWLTHGGKSPIAITGANRTAGAPGADGPANLLDAVMVAACEQAQGLGTVVVFGGEIHAASGVRKVDATGPRAFGSPLTGPIGRVVGGRVWLASRPLRPPTLKPGSLTHRVPIVTAALGEDGAALSAAATGADGLVVTAFGAGHLSAGMLGALREAVARIPVALTVRPERGAILHDTYSFDGDERDLRASGAVCAPFLSPVAARIALLCCLGAGLDRPAIAAALAPWDV
ncbi:MAG: asparaginase [Solirubrobacteraceae bacterium]